MKRICRHTVNVQFRSISELVCKIELFTPNARFGLIYRVALPKEFFDSKKTIVRRSLLQEDPSMESIGELARRLNLEREQFFRKTFPKHTHAEIATNYTKVTGEFKFKGRF